MRPAVAACLAAGKLQVHLIASQVLAQCLAAAGTRKNRRCAAELVCWECESRCAAELVRQERELRHTTVELWLLSFLLLRGVEMPGVAEVFLLSIWPVEQQTPA